MEVDESETPLSGRTRAKEKAVNRGRMNVLAAGLMAGCLLLAASGCDIGTGAVVAGGKGAPAGKQADAQPDAMLGVWKPDARRTAAGMRPGGREMTAADQAEFVRRLEGGRLEIRADGTFVFEADGQQASGTWRAEDCGCGTNGKVLMSGKDGRTITERAGLMADGAMVLLVEQPRAGLSKVYFVRPGGTPARAAAPAKPVSRGPLFLGGPS